MKDIRDMSISEIDNYGADIQEIMKDASASILNKTNMISLGDTKQELNELYDISNKHKKIMLPVVGKPLQRIRSLTTNYSKIQNRLDSINNAMEAQKERIDEHIEYMNEQIKNLDSILENLRDCENNLDVYAHELDESNLSDQTMIQAVSSRLRNINTTRIMAEQAQAEALMILAEQREAKRQLDEVIKNAIPAIQMQAVNSVGMRVNKETQEIISKSRDIIGNIVVQNAMEVKNMAEELQNNRTKSIVDDEKLIMAQGILEDALKCVTEASELEAKSNMRMIGELQEKTKHNKESIKILKNKIGKSNNITSIY